MLEFKVIEDLKPNPKIIELIKNYTYKTKKGKIKVLLHTNLQVIEPTEYLITHPITFTIRVLNNLCYCSIWIQLTDYNGS